MAARAEKHTILHAGLSLAWVAFCCTALGCTEPAVPAGRPGRGAASAPDLPVPTGLPGAGSAPPRSAARMPRPPDLPPSPSETQGRVGPGGSTTEEAAGAPPIASETDLPAAIQRAFGTPTECVSSGTRERLGGRLVVQVTVHVTADGRVTRASVSGAQLAPEDLECMRRRAEGLRLGVMVSGAPRSVTARVEYDVRATPGEVTTPDPPPVVRPPGQLAPDRTLPAQAEGPAPGQVAPGITLAPGGTATERPPGFVPPSSTLPALAP